MTILKSMSKTALAQKGVVDPKIIIGGIVVLVVIFFLATSKFNFSASRNDQPSSSQSEGQTEQPQAPSEPKSYQNDQYKFSLEYPEEWSLKEAQGGFVATFSSPAESSSDKYFEFLGVKVVSTSSKPDISLQEAADLWEQQTVAGSKDNNFQVVDRDTSTIAGKEARNIVYTLDLDKISAKGFVRITKANNNIYIFQYFAETDKYEQFLPDIESILSSVSL